MEKSGSQKALKVLSIILIVLSVISIVGMLFVLAGGGLLFTAITDGTADVPASDLNTLATATTFIVALSVVALLSAIFDLIVGILGVRGANNPQKIRPFIVMCIICIVLDVISLAFSFAAEPMDPSAIAGGVLGLAIPIICLVLANNIKKQSNF
ncbi:MAG: hypothetical protein U0M72_03875 [Eggerthellaceae bacterium]